MSASVLVTTVPFGEPDPSSRELLERAAVPYVVQPLGRRLTADELAEMIRPFKALIAGTEPITEKVMDAAPELRLIARVGIGLDGVDLLAARDRGIAVTYTPDAPSPAVAELTLGLILNACRHVSSADRDLRAGAWKRHMGRRVAGATIGVLGVGRIGSRVIRLLRGAFPDANLLAADLVPDQAFGRAHGIRWVDAAELFSSSDIVTIHVPLTPRTRFMIGTRELDSMKRGAILVNTARGGIVQEADLARSLASGQLGAAAIDVFEQEPYAGELLSAPNCLLTCHMGSMTGDCRARMETEAAAEVVRLFRSEPPCQPVPEYEFQLRQETA